jgi:hypothetical protein
MFGPLTSNGCDSLPVRSKPLPQWTKGVSIDKGPDLLCDKDLLSTCASKPVR